MKVAVAFLVLLFPALCIPLQAQDTVSVTRIDAHQPGLFINEIYLYKPDNDKMKFRKNSKVKEWIEIYNSTTGKIRVDDLYLTDDPADPEKWVLKRSGWRNRFLKKRNLLAVYFGRYKRKHVFVDGNYKASVFYLSRRIGNEAVLVDTLIIPSDSLYPYSRYPEGGKFIHTDALTPGLKNCFRHESLPVKTKGFLFNLGMSTSTSKELKGLTTFIPSGAFGIFFTKNRSRFSTEHGFKYSFNGYGIKYEDENTTSKGVRVISTKGKQTFRHLDFYYNVSHRINPSFSFFYGAAFSIQLSGHLKYDQDIVFTNSTTGQQIKTTYSYDSREYNSATDIFDIYLQFGLRYYIKDAMGISLIYSRDVWGMNDNYAVYGHQAGSGFYISCEIPFLKKRERMKSSFILKNQPKKF